MQVRSAVHRHRQCCWADVRIVVTLTLMPLLSTASRPAQSPSQGSYKVTPILAMRATKVGRIITVLG